MNCNIFYWFGQNLQACPLYLNAALHSIFFSNSFRISLCQSQNFFAASKGKHKNEAWSLAPANTPPLFNCTALLPCKSTLGQLDSVPPAVLIRSRPLFSVLILPVADTKTNMLIYWDLLRWVKCRDPEHVFSGNASGLHLHYALLLRAVRSSTCWH